MSGVFTNVLNFRKIVYNDQKPLNISKNFPKIVKGHFSCLVFFNGNWIYVL